RAAGDVRLHYWPAVPCSPRICYPGRQASRRPTAMTAPMIYVDADACPVKDEALRVAMRHRIVITFVANQGSRPTRDPMIRYVYVPSGTGAGDDWTDDGLAANAIVVTADIPLAARALEREAQVLGPTGRLFTRDSIGMALAMRDLKQHLRETGESRGL